MTYVGAGFGLLVPRHLWATWQPEVNYLGTYLTVPYPTFNYQRYIPSLANYAMPSNPAYEQLHSHTHSQVHLSMDHLCTLVKHDHNSREKVYDKQMGKSLR